MSAKTFVVDSGDVTHKLRKWFVIDSGGVTRKLKKAWVIGPGGVARLVFEGEDDLSMLVGTSGPTNAIGFEASGFGTMTPNTLGDGSTVQELAVGARLSPSPNQLIFAISGYPGTIVEAYLTSLSVNGSVMLPGDANFTSFAGGTSGGTAQWTWQNAGIPTVGATVPVVVVRT